jgi:acyl dehydratase
VVDDIESLITDEMRACIGFTTQPLEIPEEISASDVRHFVSVIGETNPIYRDAAYARSMGYNGVVVPPIFVVILFRRIQVPVGQRPGLDWGPLQLPPSFKNTRNAGQVYEWLRPVYVGDRLTVTTKLVDLLAPHARRPADDPDRFGIRNPQSTRRTRPPSTQSRRKARADVV